MTAKTRPRPITVDNSWLNKSLEDRLKILQQCSPMKLEAISVLVNVALKDEWTNIGHTPQVRHQKPYRWKCDAPDVVKKRGDR